MDTSPTLAPGTAVPAWMQQILPQWFIERPAFTEMAYSTMRSLGKTLSATFVGAYTVYEVIVPNGNLETFTLLCVMHPIAFGLPLLFASLSGNRAYAKAAVAATAPKESKP